MKTTEARQTKQRVAVTMTYAQWVNVLRALNIVAGKVDWVKLSVPKGESAAAVAAELGDIRADDLAALLTDQVSHAIANDVAPKDIIDLLRDYGYECESAVLWEDTHAKLAVTRRRKCRRIAQRILKMARIDVVDDDTLDTLADPMGRDYKQSTHGPKRKGSKS